MDDLRSIIHLMGVRMGGEDQLMGRAMGCLEMTQVMMGADWMLGSVSAYTGKRRIFSAYRPSEIVQWLGSFRWNEAALMLLGDTGFYSEAGAAVRAFVREGRDMESVPGVSSLSYFCTRLGKSWQNAHSVNSRGWDRSVVAHAHSFRSCFILPGGVDSVPDLYRQPVSSEMSSVIIWVGESSSHGDEHIAWEMTPAEPLMEDRRLSFGSLACVLVENTEAAEGQPYPQPGPGDDDYTRGQVPMTKEEVWRISLEKLCIDAQVVCYDTGAGTGSVAVEVGVETCRRGGNDQVYAIERNREVLQLIEPNYQKLYGSWVGFHIVEGEVSETMEGLESPIHVLVGRSDGHMCEIVAALFDANPHMRIMANVIILEVVGGILACMRESEFAIGETAQIWAAPVDTVGSCHMPKAQNPAHVTVMQDPKGDGGEIQWQELR